MTFWPHPPEQLDLPLYRRPDDEPRKKEQEDAEENAIITQIIIDMNKEEVADEGSPARPV